MSDPTTPVTARPDRRDVLITSASRKVLLVRAFREAIARLGGGRVLATDLSPWAVALREADGTVELPRADDAGFGDAVERLCESEGVGLVVPTRDDELPVFAGMRDRLARAGTMVLVSGAASIAACRDKVRFAQAVAAVGLDTPRVHPGRDVPMPAFVKPRTGAGARHAVAVHTVEALHAATREIEAMGGEPVVQELIDAPEFTIDVYLDRSSRPISCIPRERIVVVGGESVVSRTVIDQDLSNATIRLCVALGLTGHVTVQAFRTADRIAFIEVNPRFGGAANLGFAAGAPTPEFAIREARGETLTPRLGEYEPGLVMLRYAEDRFVRDSSPTVDTGMP